MNSRTAENTRVLIFYDRPEEFYDEIALRFPSVTLSTCQAYDQLSERLQEVRPNVVLAYKFEPKAFPRTELVNCPTIEWLSVAFAGVDHVAPWDEDKLVVTSAAGVAAPEMGQYALAAIFSLFQGIPQFYRDQHSRRWCYRLVRSARGATVGLVGFGHAGKEIARLCKAVGLRVIVCRASPQPSDLADEVYGFRDLNRMLSRCDVALVCAALTSETCDLFDKSRFAAMKPNSYFINMARGAIVQEDALIQALESGHLSGAVLDVTRTEPLPQESPLWNAPNILITPHTSSEYVGWFRDAALLFADNLDRWLKNEN